MNTRNPTIDVFNRDALDHGGYVYTATERLSSRMATDTSTRTVLSLNAFSGRRVLDVGCGDGYYAFRYWDHAQPTSWEGVDPAREAISVANRTKGDRPLTFRVADGHALPYADDSFEVVLLQSVLHHDDDPRATLCEAFRVAPTVVIHDPNGYNPVLKVLERVMPYHRAHNEQSYAALQLRRWVREAGGRTVIERFAGLVPMFCPDWMACGVKLVEPGVERVPVVRTFTCAVYVSVNQRRSTSARYADR
jgi:ubiquinone/menaquinone biosynthesis C-methylase UbiE